MSRVSFHTYSEEVEVRGSERALANNILSNMALGVFDIKLHYNGVINLIPKDHYISEHIAKHTVPNPSYWHKDDNVIDMIETCMRVSMDGRGLFIMDGKQITSWHLILNTAMTVGSDTIKFLGRLHAQCEIHGYIRGKNKAWIAGIIEDGLEEGVLREEAGWEDVVKLLRKNATETVVTSYSVCESFPNADVADWEAPMDEEYDEPNYDTWYDLSKQKRWTSALRGLVKNEHVLLEWKPDGWNDVGFGDGTTVFDIHKHLYDNVD